MLVVSKQLSGRSPSVQEIPRTVGIDVQVEWGAVTIQRVLFGSPAFRAGLRAGDRIVKVNGADARTMSYRQLIAALDGSFLNRALLLTIRDGELRGYSLAAEDLQTISQQIREYNDRGGRDSSEPSWTAASLRPSGPR